MTRIDLAAILGDFSRTNPTLTVVILISITLVLLALRLHPRGKSHSPRLRGPPRSSLIFGATEEIWNSSDLGGLYGKWEKTYGPVYEIPSSLGSKILIVGDPKAIAHFSTGDTTRYHTLKFAKTFFRQLFGNMLVMLDGEDHKRQRRALSLAFSNAAVRNLIPVFLDSASKLKTAWESSFLSGSSDSETIDVQQWMSYVSLDSIGNGGFSHDFGCLRGSRPPVLTAFDSFGSVKPSFKTMLSFLLAPILPTLSSMIPNERKDKMKDLGRDIRAIAADLLDKAAKEKAAFGTGEVDKSIIGALVRSERSNSNIHMSIDEIMAQMVRELLGAGYETTSAAMTWSLIEVARNPDVQETLRAELRRELVPGEGPTHDQLMNALPYLDAFVCEILRVHPPAVELTREAHENDTLPLTHPIRTASGDLTDAIFVPKGTIIRIPIVGVNSSEALWGADAAQFNPKRWLNESDDAAGARSAEIQGYRHLLTFGYGPRMCLGRIFAVTEIKVVLSLLLRHYAFEFPNGPSTKLDTHRSLTVRPKVAGEEGPKLPLIVKRIVLEK